MLVKLLNQVIRIEIVVSAIFLISTLLLILVQMVSRSFFALPLLWSEEVARLLFIWLVFLSAAPVLATGKHIVVDVITEKQFGRRVIGVIDAFATLLVLLSCGFMAWASYGLVDSMSGLSLPTSGWPQLTLYGASFIAFALLTLHAAINLVRLVMYPINGTPTVSES